MSPYWWQVAGFGILTWFLIWLGARANGKASVLVDFVAAPFSLIFGLLAGQAAVHTFLFDVVRLLAGIHPFVALALSGAAMVAVLLSLFAIFSRGGGDIWVKAAVPLTVGVALLPSLLSLRVIPGDVAVEASHVIEAVTAWVQANITGGWFG